jgi:uncharacterized protein YcbX
VSALGTVIELWRYPVKSFRGERLDRASLGPDGVEGDRGFALRDPETGRILSAKKVSRLLEARATCAADGAVTLFLPTGEELAADGPGAAERLSDWLGRRVELVRPPGGPERPVVEGDDGPFRGRPGGFFDSSAVHFVTTSTLATLTGLYPAGRFDARRFRPNVVLATEGPGFVEETWVGETVRLGTAVIEISKPCSRCVMTTHAQEDLPVDRDILRTVNEHNDEHVGVYGIVREPGEVALGDGIHLD